MLRWEGQLLLLIIAVVGILFAGIIWYDLLIPFAISPIHFFGFIILSVLSYALLSIYIIKGLSPAFVSELVHDTINYREILFMSWNNPLTDSKEPEEIAIAPLGGIDAVGIHPKSSPNSPIVIMLSKYFGQAGKSYGTLGCEIPIPHSMVPEEIHDFCTQMMGTRYTKCKGQIYIVLTSPVDNTNDVENQKAVYKFLEDNKRIRHLTNELDDMMTLDEKKKKLSKPQYYLEKAGVIEER